MTDHFLFGQVKIICTFFFLFFFFYYLAFYRKIGRKERIMLLENEVVVFCFALLLIFKKGK